MIAKPEVCAKYMGGARVSSPSERYVLSLLTYANLLQLKRSAMSFVSLLIDLFFLPFTVVLGSFLTMIELAWDIAWEVAGITIVFIEYALWTSWKIATFLFDTLPTLMLGVYNAILAAIPVIERVLTVVKHAAEAVLKIIVSTARLPWREIFFRFTSGVSSITGYVASLLESGDSEMDTNKSPQPGIVSTLVTFVVYGLILWMILSFILFMWYFAVELYANLRRRQTVSTRRQPENNTVNVQRQRRQRSRSRSTPHEDVDLEFAQRAPDIHHRSSSEWRFAAPQDAREDAPIRETASQPAALSSMRQDSLNSDTELLRRRLHEANEKLSAEKDKSLCAICFDKERDVIVKPCNHYCLCGSCSREVRECPMCKKRIQKREKVFHS